MSKRASSAKVFLWRFYLLLLVFVVLVISLIWHLASLQVLPDTHRGFEFLQDQGLARTLRTESVPAYRGMITDRHGQPLAVSTPVVSLWANPKELLMHSEQWPLLAKALGMKEAALAQRIARYKQKSFMYLRRQMSPDDAKEVMGLGVAGVYERQEFRRFYPAGEVTAQIVGFTNVDDQGQEGIELAYDQWLAGTIGKKQVLKDLSGRTIKEVAQQKEALSGKDLQLSLDLRLQYTAYRELKAAVKAHKAKSASMVVLDIKTGEVLAMVNQPSFNPNNRKGLAPRALRNRAMTDQFEPGSTMKPLTVMAALEAGKVTPTTVIATAPGYMKVGRKTLVDPVNYGDMTVSRVITKSSQVGLTKISLAMEAEQIRHLFFRFGLGQSTGVGFPGESHGVLPNHTKWQPIVQANFSFGYGMTVTALQLAQAYSVIADQGRKKPVFLLKQEAMPASQSVVAPEIASQMVEMLKTVVSKEGTAKKAQLVDYPVAGKTGTIHKVGKQGYADNRYISLFAGFAPASNPRLAAVVVVHEPRQGQYFGGEVAAPVFARVIERSLQLLQEPPLAAKTRASL